MYLIFDIERWISIVRDFALLAIAIFAFVNALLYSAESYDVAGKLTKQVWLIILACSIAIEVFPLAFAVNLNILQIAAAVAPLVYLLDVRPAVAGLYRR